jgi:methylmalonyl-CoA mutase N-terminal domain/subunit
MSKERKKKFLTSSQIEVKTVYTEKDLLDFYPAKSQSLPGEFPFTRGIYPNMYRGKLWTMRQYAGFATAEESNKRYRFLLSQGQTGLSVAFDLPTQIGLDSDHPLSKGEVGKVGVAVDTLKDMDILFEDIPLDKVSVSMTINSTAIIILAMYLALAENRGIPWDQLRGTIQNDILKEYIARGTYIYPPEPSLKIITDILAFCHKNVPHWNTMSISGYHIREAGATAVQELAFTFGNAVEYIKAAVDAGLDIDTFAPRLSFFLASHNNLFEEIAKFRAARRIWANIVRNTFGASNPHSWRFRFHTQTSGVTLVAQEPENNVVRVALQALSAVLGGTQSLHTNSRDEALALPSEKSAQIALRTQQIIAFESEAADCVDPLGGSYFVETLTNQIEDKVQEYLKKIEDLGGMQRAIETGFVQKEIQESAYLAQKQIETKDQIIVSLNEFINQTEAIHFDLYFQPEEVEKNQLLRLKRIKKERSEKRVRHRLNLLREASLEGKNLFPAVLDAVKDLATLEEIASVLRDVYGTYQENISI